MRAEGYERRRETLAGWEVGVVSYKLGDRYYCVVDNVTPGARLARAGGATRAEAETAALGIARDRLVKTRTHPV